MTGESAADGDLAGKLAEARFGELYGENMRAVLGYALRRCADPDDAADVVAETFLVAWRRLGEVPLGDDGRPWLFGTARRVLAEPRPLGAAARPAGGAAAGRAAASASRPPGPRGGARPRGAGRPARARPGAADADRLGGAGAGRGRAGVGISATAARVRLHRARRRLRARLAERRTPDPHKTETRVEEAR